MSDRPGELSTADFAGQQTRDPDAPAVRPDERMPEGDERLARENERGDTAWHDPDRVDVDDAGPGYGETVHDHGETVHDHGETVHDHGETVHDHGSDLHDHGGDVHDHGGEVAGGAAGGAAPLMATGDAEGFRARWTDVQTSFVDSPRDAVQQADGLVAEVMQHLASTFADERSNLERQWDRADSTGDDIATDDLRSAFQRYRSFFERLLAT